MKKVKLFEQFISEQDAKNKDLFKVCLVYDPDYGHRFWSYKDYSTDKFFVKLTPEEYKKNKDVDKSLPVLNYNADFTQKLIDDGKIDPKNVYNLPDAVKQSNKDNFHKLMDGTPWVPKTCHDSKKATKDIGFPMIAKPSEGHSGEGITVLKNQKEFDAADHSKLDVYSEYIDKTEEHRFFVFKGKIWFWQERTPTNDKAKTGKGDSDERMMFDYKRKKLEGLPEDYQKVSDEVSKIFKDLPYLCLDMMKDKAGKVYVIETNAMPGVPFDSTVEAYKLIFKDFYNREPNKECCDELQKCADHMNKKTIDGYRKYDKGRFSVEK
jgi:hypothetical protein